MKIMETRTSVSSQVMKLNSVQLTWLQAAIKTIVAIKSKDATDADISRWTAFTTILSAKDDEIGKIRDFMRLARVQQ